MISANFVTLDAGIKLLHKKSTAYDNQTEISLNPWSIIDLKARSIGNQRVDEQGCRAPVHHNGSDSHRIALGGLKLRFFAGSR